MMTPDGKWAYAGTMGESAFAMQPFVDPAGGWWCDESAFSISGHEGDLGNAWNQSGLIDTDIDFIADVAVASNPAGKDPCSPSCSCIYIATINHETPWEQTAPAPYWEYAEGKICGCDSIWRSCDGGKSWLRIWHKELQGAVMDPAFPWNWPSSEGIEWMTIELVPGETTPMTIYMADLGTETVYRSTASGNACCPAGLGCWTDRNTGLGNRYIDYPDLPELVVDGDGGIADIAVLDESTIYAVAFNGDMVKSTSGGRHWSSQVDTKVDGDSGELAHDIIAMGDWVVLGGDMGTVTYSKDGGDSFKELDDIGSGQVHLAFDSYFDSNGYLYAAVAGADNGVWRTTIDKADFEDMDACDELDYWGIVVSNGPNNPKTSASTGGVLYASYNGSAVDEGCKSSGVARILNPASQDCCGSLSWDYLFDDLDAYAWFVNQPTDIAICGDASGGATTIWAIDLDYFYWAGWDECYTEFYDSCVGRLWKFNDVFAKSGPALIGVANGATIPTDPCDCVNEEFILEWDRICDACEYDIQIAMDEGFKHIIWKTSTIDGAWPTASMVTHDSCSEGMLVDLCESPATFYKPSDPCAPSIVVPQGTLDCNQTYWWRVRARAAETGEVYRSWWSDKWSFTIAVGPDGAIKLTSPDDGATNVPLQNVVFTWTSVADATSYDLKVWDASGKEIGSNAANVTSFVLTSKLAYDTPYMWQVKAMKGSAVLSESPVSTFRTMMEPTKPPTIPETVINFPEPAGTPSWVWVVIALAAILIIVVIVLIFRTRRV